MAPFESRFVAAFGMGALVAAFGALTNHWLVWPALVCAWVAIGYAGMGARVFAKNSRGRIHPVAMVALAPYFAVTWLVVLALRTQREAGHHEIRPRLFLGRRPLRVSELPEGVSLVVDMTAELGGLRAKGVEYICLPTLDGSAPHDHDAARALVARIRAHDGIAYVHCAAGHGRSAAIVACVLIAEGRAADVREALALIRAVRPRAGLSRSQRAFVRALTPVKT